jgi:uncharacterized membrane protein YeaQ/YmgE (transglycosylase-associated protein family)
MNPGIGLLGWIIIGALAGWIASKIMGTNARQGAVANVVIGVIGALVGGFVAHRLLGENLGSNGLLASFGVALAGSCIVIFVWKLLSGRKG